MGLFGKKKKEDEETSKNQNQTPLPPPPSSQENNTNNQETNNIQENNSNNIPEFGTMPQPPSSFGEFNDIKQQISTPNNQQSTSQEETHTSTDDIDSLFDLSDLEIQSEAPKTIENQNITQQTNQEEEKEDIKSPQKSKEDEELDQKESKLNLIKTQGRHRNNPQDNIYITTSQFKMLLEIVEEVKLKTKDSSERYLRLLDLKAEEDIEYESLKKDFGQIEDKLYQVDSLIFEK